MSYSPESIRKSQPVPAGIEWLLILTGITVALAFLYEPASLSYLLIALLAGTVFLRFDFFVYASIAVLPWYPFLRGDFFLRDVTVILRVVLFLGVWILQRRKGKTLSDWALASRTQKLVAALAIVFLVSLLFSPVKFRQDAYRLLMRQFSYFLLFFGLTGWIETRPQIHRVLTVVLCSTIIVNLFGLLQELMGSYTGFYFLLYPLQLESALPEWSGRITSFLFHFNSLAGYLNVALSVAVGALVLAPSMLVRGLGAVCFMTLIPALYLTGSRGGIVAGLLTLLFAVWAASPSRRALVQIGALLVCSVFLITFVLRAAPGGGGDVGAAAQVEHVEDIQEDFSTVSRFVIWSAALSIFAQHPILGVGYGNFRALYGDYIPGAVPEQIDSHNFYLQYLSEVGIVGFVLVMYVFGRLLRMGWQLTSDTDLTTRWIGLGVCGAIVSTLVHGFVDFLFNGNPQYGALFWLIMAMGVVASRGLPPHKSVTVSQA